MKKLWDKLLLGLDILFVLMSLIMIVSGNGSWEDWAYLILGTGYFVLWQIRQDKQEGY